MNQKPLDRGPISARKQCLGFIAVEVERYPIYPRQLRCPSPRIQDLSNERSGNVV